MKTKSQKGITLIALIITIIVMLILVGVSVSVALNTGLFKTAQGAAKNTQLAASEENTISSGMVKIKNATTGELEEVDIKSFAGTPELDLSGAEGTPVAYSAGGVNDWKIYEKNEEEGTVTILGKSKVPDLTSFASKEEFLEHIKEQYTNDMYEESIKSVELISIDSRFENSGSATPRDYTEEEKKFCTDFGITVPGNYIFRITTEDWSEGTTPYATYACLEEEQVWFDIDGIRNDFYIIIRCCF